MKKALVLFLVLILFTGCATYQVCALQELGPEFYTRDSQIPHLAVGCKALTKKETLTYFDRNLLAKGIQPVQLTFRNNGNVSYYFSPIGLNLPLCSPEEVAALVHTSTKARVIGYTIVGVLSIPLVLIDAGEVASVFFISAIVDGIKSAHANDQLDADYAEKSVVCFTICPGECVQTVLFVPCEGMKPSFTLTLVEEGTGEARHLEMKIY